MKDRSIKKLILASAIFIFCIIATIFTISYAATYGTANALINADPGKDAVGKTVYINKNTGNDYVYCMFRNKAWNHADTFTIIDHVKIVGQKAHYAAKNKDNTSVRNAKLAYFFGGSNRQKGYRIEGGTLRQKMIWYYMQAKWKTNNLHNDILNNWYTSDSNNLWDSKYGTWDKNAINTFDKEAEAYANGTGKGASVSLTSTKLGTYKITYTGTLSSIVVYDHTGSNRITNPNLTFYIGNSGNGVSYDTAKKTIKSGDTFEIRSNKVIGKVEANVSVPKVIEADIWFLKPPYSKKLFHHWTTQPLLIVKTKEITDVKKATVTVPSITLTVVKVDSQNRNKKLANAEFKLYHRDMCAVASKSGSTYTVTEWVAKTSTSATIFKTDANGNITIKTKKDFNSLYALYETKAPNGYDIGLKIITKSGMTNATIKANGIGAYFNLDSSVSGDVTPSITLGNGETPLLQKLQITIVKVDGYDHTTPIQGAKFQLYSEEDSKFLDKVYTSKADGTVTTDEVEFGTYRIYEIAPGTAKDEEGNTIRYELSDEKGNGYNASKNWVNCGTVDLDESNQPVVKHTVKVENHHFGDLEIKKVDGYNNKNTPIPGVEFEVYNEDTNKLVKKDVTNEKGILSLNKLKFGTYHIYETKPADGYDLSEQDGYDAKNKRVDFGTVTIDFKHQTVSKTFINEKYGDLSIRKRDSSEGTELEGAVFKLYSVKYKNWVSGKGQTHTYDKTFANATEYITEIKEDEEGEKIAKVEINKLEYGEYEVYETKAPDGYDLKSQGEEGDYNEDLKAVKIGTYEISSNDKEINIVVSNIKTISIEGYVWIDEIGGKFDKSDGKYVENTKDKKVEGVTVKLMRKNGKNNPVKSVTTGKDGKYTLDEKITPDKLDEYYIEFDYKNIQTGNQKYIPVKFNATEAEKIIKNGSRALADELPEEDAKISGIASTYKGNNEQAENIYGLSGNLFDNLLSENGDVLENINLGLIPVHTTEFLVQQDVAFARIGYDGDRFNYPYISSKQIKSEDVPVVNWVSGKTFSMPIYPAEIMRNNEQPGKLNAYIVYKIIITNTANYGVPDIYKEVNLNIKSLVEEMGNGYELDTTIPETSEVITEEIKKHFDDWELKNGKASYKGDVFKNGITVGSPKTVYIQFKLTNDALNEILSKGHLTNNSVKAYATGYHNYTRNDYGWKYMKIDEESEAAPEIIKTNAPHKTPDSECTAQAGSMTFRLPGNRTITGTVFKDEGDKVGNGINDSVEKKVEGIKVQLLESDGKTKAKRYIRNEDGTTKTEDGPVTTYSNGQYSIKGLLPGEYKVQFIYGNVKEYKSTIVTMKSAKAEIQKEKGQLTGELDKEWYRKYTEDEVKNGYEGNCSVAVDNLDIREKINAGTEEINTMEATTPLSLIKIENTDKDVMNLEDIKVDANGNLLNLNKPYEGFNFGIIEQPRARVALEKVITNVKLTRTDNTVVFNGNPQTGAMKGVTDLDGDNNNGGSKYTRIELSEDSIYGSDFEITYKIKVTNNSDINYCEIDDAHYGYYYLYGEHDSSYSREVELKIDNVIDYLDPSLKYVSSDGTIKGIKYVTNQWKDPESNRIYDIADKVIKTQESINSVHGVKFNYKELLSIENMNNIARGENGQIFIVAQRALSTQDDDMETINAVEITNASNSVKKKSGDPENNDALERSLKLVRAPELPGPAKAVSTITPPTGEDRNIIYIYSIAGILALIALTTGIVIIKKKVL